MDAILTEARSLAENLGFDKSGTLTTDALIFREEVRAMCDLFLAGFNRLWRSRVFQICCLVSFAANVFVMLATYRQVLNYTELGLEHSITLDSVFYGLVPVLGVMCAAFVSLFIGTEHSDGVMRNMLVVGRADHRHQHTQNNADDQRNLRGFFHNLSHLFL